MWSLLYFSRRRILIMNGSKKPSLVYSQGFARELLESQEEERKEESIGYVALRNLFTRETTEMQRVEKKSRETTLRESADRIHLVRKVNAPDAPMLCL